MKVAIITGAASGIGQALALQYAKAGVAVVGSYYIGDEHDPAITQSLVEAAGGKCLMVAANVQLSDETDALAQKAKDTFGRIDYVVANAGLIRQGSVTDSTDSHYAQMLDVNLIGVMRTVRSAARLMESGGAIVAVSSFLGACQGASGFSAYSAAKAGVVGYCMAAAKELSERRIRFNTVIPGLIETPQTLDTVNSVGASGLELLAKFIPFQRVGKADEVASLINYLTHGESTYITGQAIAVDGGMTTSSIVK